MLDHLEIINNHNLITVFMVILSYLLGSIPCGLIIGKIFAIGDIRKSGSGNIGATNMLRVGGKKLGAFTLIADISKGLLACYIARKLGGDHLMLLAAELAIIGHIFPIWLKFKGGKGVATSFGVFCYCDLKIGLVCLAIWLVTFVFTRISSLGAILSFSLAPVIAYFLSQDIWVFVMVLVACILVMIRHYENIIRLVNKNEKSL
jgi:glycerol-3-phosphate acyltransferase PlsY